MIVFIFSFIFSENIVQYSKLPVIGENDFKLFYENKKILDKVEYVDFNKYYKDGPILVSFWFLGCVPCMAEMKHLTKFNEKYKDSGFKVLSINTDKRNKARVKSLVKKKKYSFDMIFDLKGSDGLLKKFGGSSCPFTVLINKDGTIFSKHIGYEVGDEITLEKNIQDLISYNQNLKVSENIEVKSDKQIEPEENIEIE